MFQQPEQEWLLFRGELQQIHRLLQPIQLIHYVLSELHRFLAEQPLERGQLKFQAHRFLLLH